MNLGPVVGTVESVAAAMGEVIFYASVSSARKRLERKIALWMQL